jgi:hypothetical protein
VLSVLCSGPEISTTGIENFWYSFLLEAEKTPGSSGELQMFEY